MFFCVPGIEPPNHLSGQRRPPIPARPSDGGKGRRFMLKSPSTFPVSTIPYVFLCRDCYAVDNPASPQIAAAMQEALSKIRRVYSEELLSQNSK